MPDLIYRTYDPIFKRMVEPGGLALSLDALEGIAKQDTHQSLTGVEEPHIHIFEVLNMMAKVNGYIYMRYIGIRDKNDKPIFEDDIVRTNFNIGSGMTEEPIYVGEVELRAGEYVLKDRPIVHPISSLYRNKWTLEVIGNIHQNPELRP